MSDERQNLPSASGIERIALCPGSFLMEQECPRVETEDSRHGDTIHAALLKGSPEGLTLEQQDTMDSCLALRDKTREEIGAPEYWQMNVWRERRFWLVDEDGQRVLSGQFDECWMWMESGRVIMWVNDYKTLWGDATEAASNWQLATLAVLVANQTTMVDEVFVSITAPNQKPSRTVAKYTHEELVAAKAEIIRMSKAAMLPGGELRKGEKQCKYCRAKTRCPEARSTVEALTVVPPTLPALSGEQVAFLLDRCEMADDVIKAIKSEAKARLGRGEVVPGWHLKPGNTVENITDPETVHARFLTRGGTTEQFMETVTVGKGNLKEAVAAVTGKKGKGLGAEMAEILAGCTEEKQNAPSLARMKEAA